MLGKSKNHSERDISMKLLHPLRHSNPQWWMMTLDDEEKQLKLPKRKNLENAIMDETLVIDELEFMWDSEKSTSGICTFVGFLFDILVLKETKQLLLYSTTKAEYVSARRHVQQALWMKQASHRPRVRILDGVPIIVTDNQEKDKIEAKTTKPSTGTERA
ncbi:hypothetical protein Tco_0236124 [Tanacetum coccineum]